MLFDYFFKVISVGLYEILNCVTSSILFHMPETRSRHMFCTENLIFEYCPSILLVTLCIVILPQLTTTKIFLFVFLLSRMSPLKTQNPLGAFEPMQIRWQNSKHLLCHSLFYYLFKRAALFLRSCVYFMRCLSKHFLVCIFHNSKIFSNLHFSFSGCFIVHELDEIKVWSFFR